MPIDPFTALNAMIRAEAARIRPLGTTAPEGAPEPDGEPAPAEAQRRRPHPDDLSTTGHDFRPGRARADRPGAARPNR
ncbi:hypothetical protein [Streptomyces sp. NPDC048111]|uniref:hypothetical protein n=1 Tax=Streptomyces sp. NPDC048111 TaxID=3365500 RepID=UPI0037235F9D